jgi:hypothetical protein
MVDASKLSAYSDAHLREIRVEVVKEIDANRLVVAKGMIGRGRVAANRKAAEGRVIRDAIDVLLKERVEAKANAQLLKEVMEPPTEPVKEDRHQRPDSDGADR